MTRAFLVLAVLLCAVGCREEPTIVIKFEPNDLAGLAAKPALDLGTKPAARAADLAVVAEEPGPQKKLSQKKQKAAGECKVAADCVVVPSECCDCANGGKQHAIPKKALAAAQAARADKCKAKMCTMMLSTDPSCGQRPDCVDGACVMTKKK